MNRQLLRFAHGGRIDRTRPLSFRFDGKQYQGFAGDTLASALLANGVRVVGRSFKLHRARGVLGNWSEEPNAIVQIGRGAQRVPNLKATQVELREGLEARSVNCWPNARHDVWAALQWLSPLLPAGFYYKTFMWPSWRWFEPTIRLAAGLGTAPAEPDPDRYEERYEHCDVLIIGGGPAGISAALAASRAGARAILVDDRPQLGGALQWEQHRVNDGVALEWVEQCEREIRSRAQCRVLKRTTAFGHYDHGLVALCEREPVERPAVRERLWHVRAKQVVLASGAIERPIVFPNNDLPGVMLASAAMCYAVQYGVAPGRRAVFVTSCDSAYESALALHQRNVTIEAIVDTRSERTELHERAERAGLRVYSGYIPVRALRRIPAPSLRVPAASVIGVRGLEIRPLGAADRRTRELKRLSCDLICVSGGWSPTTHLFSQAGGALSYREELAALAPATSLNNLQCAGAAAGHFSLDACLGSGFASGLAAAAALGAGSDAGQPPAAAAYPAAVSMFWESAPQDRESAWVDLQNDVTRADLELASRENLRSIEHVKRYTTTGMAIDQGKTGNMNCLGVLARISGRRIPELGTTTFRPPYDPVTLGTLAAQRIGCAYHPLKRTPLHAWNLEHAAVMEEFGGWLRPAWYARPPELRTASIRHEKKATRNQVSVFDGSPLGKLEVRGPDAGEFLDRMYYNNMATLAPGRVRYGLMLNEHGVIIDDGVCMRLGPQHYLVSTTSSGAGRIFTQFEDWLQCEWPQLSVLVANVTAQWGNIAVAGPRARELLQRLDTDVDLTAEAFPHLSIRTGTLCGIPARIARVGYTGELSYEISVPAGFTASLWEALLAAGASLGVTPLGVEALQELRTEKGFLHVGTDTDGRTLPADVGLQAVLERKAGDFVGRRSLYRADARRPDRLQLVGLAAEDPLCVLAVGAHVVEETYRYRSSESVSARRDPLDHALTLADSASEGYVTSSCESEALGRGVALGLVRAGRARLGQRVLIYAQGELTTASIVSPGWYDPQGLRMYA